MSGSIYNPELEMPVLIAAIVHVLKLNNLTTDEKFEKIVEEVWNDPTIVELNNKLNRHSMDDIWGFIAETIGNNEV